MKAKVRLKRAATVAVRSEKKKQAAVKERLSRRGSSNTDNEEVDDGFIKFDADHEHGSGRDGDEKKETAGNAELRTSQEETHSAMTLDKWPWMQSTSRT